MRTFQAQIDGPLIACPLFYPLQSSSVRSARSVGIQTNPTQTAICCASIRGFRDIRGHNKLRSAVSDHRFLQGINGLRRRKRVFGWLTGIFGGRKTAATRLSWFPGSKRVGRGHRHEEATTDWMETRTSGSRVRPPPPMRLLVGPLIAKARLDAVRHWRTVSP